MTNSATPPEPDFSVPSSSVVWIIDPPTGDNIIYINGKKTKTFTADEGYDAMAYMCKWHAHLPCVLRFGEDGDGFVMSFSPKPIPNQEIYFDIETVIHSAKHQRKTPFWRKRISFPVWLISLWIVSSVFGAAMGMRAVAELSKFCMVDSIWPW